MSDVCVCARAFCLAGWPDLVPSCVIRIQGCERSSFRHTHKCSNYAAIKAICTFSIFTILIRTKLLYIRLSLDYFARECVCACVHTHIHISTQPFVCANIRTHMWHAERHLALGYIYCIASRVFGESEGGRISGGLFRRELCVQTVRASACVCFCDTLRAAVSGGTRQTHQNEQT